MVFVCVVVPVTSLLQDYCWSGQQQLHLPFSLNWRQGKDLPIDKLVFASSVVMNGVLYCGGNNPSS